MQFLTNKGYQVIDRNVAVVSHEVDIVAIDSATNELVFVEVKTRSSASYGEPSVAITRAKVRAMQKAATQYRLAHQLHQEYRFDAIAILPNSIEHYENITWGMVK